MPYQPLRSFNISKGLFLLRRLGLCCCLPVGAVVPLQWSAAAFAATGVPAAVQGTSTSAAAAVGLLSRDIPELIMVWNVAEEGAAAVATASAGLLARSCPAPAGAPAAATGGAGSALRSTSAVVVAAYPEAAAAAFCAADVASVSAASDANFCCSCFRRASRVEDTSANDGLQVQQKQQHIRHACKPQVAPTSLHSP